MSQTNDAKNNDIKKKDVAQDDNARKDDAPRTWPFFGLQSSLAASFEIVESISWISLKKPKRTSRIDISMYT